MLGMRTFVYLGCNAKVSARTTLRHTLRDTRELLDIARHPPQISWPRNGVVIPVSVQDCDGDDVACEQIRLLVMQ